MDAPNPKLAEQFGRYRISKRLGQGGMGSVYLAQDTHLGRAVALKLPDFGQHEAPEARRRFLEEARTAATLDHPYLCRVYDTGEIEGQLYLTMAYIEGQSLAALIGDEGWPQRQVAALVGKLALALQEAHTRKVIHRDLKPANIMIKASGGRREPVIVDFGLARRDNPQDQRLTRSGQIMGTLAYMAPEQIRGDLNEIGPACDIYALGVILYELLTGRLPFNGSGLAVAGQILTRVPLHPSTHRSDLDPGLEAICLKAMAKSVGDRYASMAELAAALTGFLQSPSASPTPSAPVGSPASPSSTSSKQPQPAGSNSLIGQFLAQLAGTTESPTPKPTAEPVTSPAPLPERRQPTRPLIVAAAALGVILPFAIVTYVVTDKSRTTNTAADTAVRSTGSDERPAQTQVNKRSDPGVSAKVTASSNAAENPAELLVGEPPAPSLAPKVESSESRSKSEKTSAWSKLMAKLGQQSSGPAPYACWTFESDARDAIGTLHGGLLGGAQVREGRLYLDGKTAHMRTERLSKAIREKTLEAWVILPNLMQRGGGVISIEHGSTFEGTVFDAIVFGERERAKWIAGSDHYSRTKALVASHENAKPTDAIHMAIVYDSDGGITVYREGGRYAERYIPRGDRRPSKLTPRARRMSCSASGSRGRSTVS